MIFHNPSIDQEIRITRNWKSKVLSLETVKNAPSKLQQWTVLTFIETVTLIYLELTKIVQQFQTIQEIEDENRKQKQRITSLESELTDKHNVVEKLEACQQEMELRIEEVGMIS